MNDTMEFPETFERFAEEYGFKDSKEVYTNGSDLIPVFRVKQWLEHDNRLRMVETDTAYECGKHANKWILVSDKVPENRQECFVTLKSNIAGGNICEIATYATNLYKIDEYEFADKKNTPGFYGFDGEYGYFEWSDVIAWQPLPEPYSAEAGDEE